MSNASQRSVARLRQAARADIAAMHRVRMSVRENRLRSIRLTGDDYIAAIEPPGRGWVVEVDGEIAGFAIANGSTGNVWALFVHPDHEARGFGRKLHDAMVAWLWERGLERLRLTTEPGTRAERFYIAAGWKKQGTTEGGEIRFELVRRRDHTNAASTELAN